MKKITALWFLILSVSAPAEEYFISPQGDDANPGTIGQPWRTISHGLNSVSAGDTLTLRGGVYRLIEETNRPSYINTPNLTLQGHAGETVVLLGSYSTASDTWQTYNANVWRIPADQLSRDPKGMFNGDQRIDHQTNFDSGRNHDHVSNLVEPNHWTKADINGTQCFADNSGCYIYLYPKAGEVPNNEVYELSQHGLPRTVSDYFTLRNVEIYYTQSSPMFFEGADFVTLEDNVFGHVSNGNDNSYGVRIWNSEGSVVRRNKVFDSVYWGGTSNSKGITFMISKAGEPNLVEYNEIYDIPGRSAVGTKGGTSNLIVRYNYIHDVYNAFEPGHYRCTQGNSCQIGDPDYHPGGDWQIYGNIVTNTEVGLRLPAFDEDNHNNHLYNNVFYQVKSAVEMGWDGSFGTVIANNIIMNGEVGIYLKSGSTTTTVDDYLDQFTSHHNLYFNNSHADIHLRPNWGGNFYSGTPFDLASFQSQFSQRELQSISFDPQFINTTDFYLSENSPAVDAGDGAFWNVPAVHMGAHPFTVLSDVIFVDGFDIP